MHLTKILQLQNKEEAMNCGIKCCRKGYRLQMQIKHLKGHVQICQEVYWNNSITYIFNVMRIILFNWSRSLVSCLCWTFQFQVKEENEEDNIYVVKKYFRPLSRRIRLLKLRRAGFENFMVSFISLILCTMNLITFQMSIVTNKIDYIK